MINAYIEQAIHSIENERDQRIAEIKNKIMCDKVAPQNAEIDTKRDNAIQEMQTKLNADITALQEKFARERQEIIDASERQKTSNAETLIKAETANITYEYDMKISELKKIIGA